MPPSQRPCVKAGARISVHREVVRAHCVAQVMGPSQPRRALTSAWPQLIAGPAQEERAALADILAGSPLGRASLVCKTKNFFR